MCIRVLLNKCLSLSHINRVGTISRFRPLLENTWPSAFDSYIPTNSVIFTNTPLKKSFRSVMTPTSVTTIILMIFSEVLPVSPRVLTNEVTIALKGMSRIVHFDNWQWVWKYLIIHIRLFKNSCCCHTALGNLCFAISFPIRSKYSSDNEPCACYNVWYAER